MTKLAPVMSDGSNENGLSGEIWRAVLLTKGSLNIAAELAWADPSGESSFLKILKVSEKDKI